MQDPLEKKDILSHIGQIFQTVLKKLFCEREELSRIANIFLERKMAKYDLGSQNAPPSLPLLHSIKIKQILVPEESMEPLDYFGEYYLANLTASEKRKLGIVYTPKWLAHKMIVNALNVIKQQDGSDVTCLDPCCGTGIFLLESLWHEYSILPQKKQTADSLLSLLSRIIGMDRDPIACLCSSLNLYLFAIRLQPTLCSILLQEPGLIQVFEQDFLLGHQIPIQNQAFLKLLIVGNPPYVFIRNLSTSEKTLLKENFSSSTWQFDIYGLFFERSLQLLPLDGVVSFVIPDSVLTLQNRRTTRELLLQRTHILKIWRVGDIFPGISVASVVLTAQKVPSESDKSQFLTEIEDFAQRENLSVNKIPQDTFIQAGNSFAPAFMASSHSILPQLRQSAISISEFNATRLRSEQILIARGIEIGKNGIVVECPKCHIFYPQPAKSTQCPSCNEKLKPFDSIFFTEGHIPTNFARTEKKPIVLGMQRWHCEDTHLVAWGLRGLKYKDPAHYSDHRVIIRQLLQKGRICATIPPVGATTTQSIYNLNLPSLLDPLEVLAVLNSDVIAAAVNELFSSGKKLFPRILLHVLKDLPFLPLMPPPNQIKQSLHALAQQFLSNPALDEDEQSRQQLNTLVLNYLGCAAESLPVILQAVRKFTEVT